MRRGLPDPLLVVSDGAPGVIRAIEECFPRAAAPALPGAQDAEPAEQGARRRLAGVRAPGPRPAIRRPRRRWPAAARRHRRRPMSRDLPAAVDVPRRRLRGLHRASALPAAPPPRDPHHQSARAAVRRGAPAHQGDPACLRRARRAEADVRRLIRAAERWRGLKMGEFEQRQLRAIRDELDRAHAERTAPRRAAKRDCIGRQTVYPARTGLDPRGAKSPSTRTCTGSVSSAALRASLSRLPSSSAKVSLEASHRSISQSLVYHPLGNDADRSQ